MIHIILCGGLGTRLWPLSREELPKQFIKIFDDTSLFQLTALKNHNVADEFIVVCNENHAAIAEQQLEEVNLKPRCYILESIGKNTAPAIAYALFFLAPDDVVLITPSDHVIENKAKYESNIAKAKALAENHSIVLFGIVPHEPSSEYGYIECDGINVIKFHEKPNRVTAQTYIENGNFFWNSGMICSRVDVLLKAIEDHSPAIFNEVNYMIASLPKNPPKGSLIKLSEKALNKVPSGSIDYEVLEKTNHLKMIKATFQWSDVGTFDALSREFKADSDGNTSDGELYTKNSTGNFFLTGNKAIAAIDVDDIAVIDTPDALLITKRGSTTQVKEIVKMLKEKNPSYMHTKDEEIRPWGRFFILDEADTYKVKKISVLPGKRLSLQKHQYRSEHWVIVKGQARVTLGEQTYDLHPNQEIYIPVGFAHRIENSGTEILTFIETQCGDYFGEDDITRIQDDFDRGTS